MKHFHYVAVVLLAFVGSLQATDDYFVELKGYYGNVSSAAFSPDGKKVMTTSDNVVEIWETESGKKLLALRHENRVNSVKFSPDSKKVLTGSRKAVYIWDAEAEKAWDPGFGKVLLEWEVQDGMYLTVAFSPDGNKVLTTATKNFTDQTKTICIWDADSGKELKTLKGHTNIVISATFSPGGEKIVTGSWDNTAIVWDAETGKKLKKLEGHTDSVVSVVFSTDGKKIVTGSDDETAIVWDAESGKELKKLEGHTDTVISDGFSPDGKKIVTTSRDRTARIWDVESGKELQKLEGHTGSVYSVAFSPDGKRIVTGSDDNTARIWDISALDKKPSPLDLPPVEDEDDNAYRERILAEERAKELTLIEAERKIIPLVEEPDKLIPLDEQDRIWITPDRKSVVLIGRVVLREGFLELLACRVASKEHESILAIRVKPFLIHAALLATNARQGKPMQTKPTFVPANGDKINITLRWKDNTGKQHECPAQDWVWDMSSSPENAKKPMTTHWVFSGSKEYQDDEGKRRYLAEETGELFGLSNFFGSILDVPIESSADNTQLQFGCFTERIPPEETPVTIVLTPVR